jgi:hypothetical protein
MRKIIVCLLLLVYFITVKAQDKIITTKHDTISCKIITISTSRIFYEQTEADKVTGKSISIDEVEGYTRQPKTLANNQYYADNYGYIAKRMHPRKHFWTFNLALGNSYMHELFENLEVAEIDDYYLQLKQGIHLNANAHYLLSDYIGLGLQYSFLNTRLSTSILQELESTYPVYVSANVNVRQYINFVGPSVLFQQYLGQKHKLKLTENLATGFLAYRFEQQKTVDIPSNSYFYTNTDNALTTGKTIGATMGLTAEYFIRPNLSVGVGGSFLYGKLTNVTWEYKNSNGDSEEETHEEMDEPLNLSRFDYSVVLRFHF